MSNAEFIKRATAAVVDYFNRHVDVTDNGDKGEMYLDAYKKMHNECIKIEEG